MKRNAFYLFLSSYVIIVSALILSIFFIMFEHDFRDFIILIIFSSWIALFLPSLLVLRYPIYKAHRLYHNDDFENVIKYGLKHPHLLLKQDTENMYLIMAVAAWTLYDDMSFLNYIHKVHHKRLLAIKHAWLAIFYANIDNEPESLDHYLLFKKYITLIHPFNIRRKYLKKMEKLYLIISNNATH